MTDEFLAHTIGKTAARLARSVDLALATVNLSAAQYRLLLQLSDGTDASTALAKKLAVTAPSVTAVVDGLVQRGFVERSHSDRDRRRVSLKITDAGQAMLDAADLAVSQKVFVIATEVGDAETTDGLEALAFLEHAIDAYRKRFLNSASDTTAGASKR